MNTFFWAGISGTGPVTTPCSPGSVCCARSAARRRSRSVRASGERAAVRAWRSLMRGCIVSAPVRYSKTGPADLPDHRLRLRSGLRTVPGTMAIDDSIQRVTTPAGDPAWLVSSYADVRALLGDLRLGRSHPDPGRAS